MSRSTPTTFNIIELAAWNYLKTKGVVPTHVFIGPVALADLRKEAYTRAVRYIEIEAEVRHLSEQRLRVHPDIPPIKMQLVLEERKDFLMVCQEQEYLDYVIERTVL